MAWRILQSWEPLKSGDEFQSAIGDQWRLNDYPKQLPHLKYRRFVPNDDAVYDILDSNVLPRAGDQYYDASRSEWVDTANHFYCAPQSPGMLYRRRKEENFVYCMLGPGDTVQTGDEVRSPGCPKWRKVMWGPYPFSSTTGLGCQYRRPIPNDKSKYAILGEGEQVREGDEVFSTAINSWVPSNNCRLYDKHQSKGLVYRRRIASFSAKRPATISPGYGYRLLREGEKVLQGDEVFLPSCNIWSTSSNFTHGRQDEELWYRRKNEPVITDEPLCKQTFEQWWEKSGNAMFRNLDISTKDIIRAAWDAARE